MEIIEIRFRLDGIWIFNSIGLKAEIPLIPVIGNVFEEIENYIITNNIDFK